MTTINPFLMTQNQIRDWVLDHLGHFKDDKEIVKLIASIKKYPKSKINFVQTMVGDAFDDETNFLVNPTGDPTHILEFRGVKFFIMENFHG